MDETRAPMVTGYEVLGILGQGGFGIVYRARQLAVGREVALKIDNRVLVSDRDRRRFMREVTSAGALSGHPHVADVYDAGVLPDGRPYMVLELCPGGSLADRLKRHGPLSVREVRDIGIKIADALAAAHAAGVLHRDVKPANILINSYGMVALSDFGLAAMNSPGSEVSVTREALTPAYAPPEAFDLTEPMATGDVYALAATLYALLHGRPPRFPETGVVNIPTIMALHRLPIPDIAGVPSAFTDVLRQAMANDPAQRTQSLAELRDALSALSVDGLGSVAGAVPDQRPPLDNGYLGHSSPGQSSLGQSHPNHSHPGIGGPAVPPPRYAVTSPLGAGPGMAGDPRRAMTTPDALAPARPPNSPYRPSAMSTQLPTGPKSRHSILFGALAALFALLLVAGIGLLVYDNFSSTTLGRLSNGVSGTGPSASTGSAGATGSGGSTASAPPAAAALGVAVRTANCPAAEVAGAGAACVAKPECWRGLVTIAGDVSARQIACTQPHYWETFAIARLPEGVTSTDQETVEKIPVVRRLCRSAILQKSRTGAATNITRWQVAVLPPNAASFAAGVRTYRCVGALKSGERTGSAFSA